MHSVSAWCELKNSIVSINIKIVLCLLQTEGTVKSFFGGSVAHDGAMSLEDAPACSHSTSLIAWLSRHVLYAQTHLATADFRYGFWDGSPPQFLVSPNPAIASATFIKKSCRNGKSELFENLTRFWKSFDEILWMIFWKIFRGMV